MTLRRQLTLQIAATIVGMLLLSAASLWGLNGLHQDFGAALESYQDLRSLYEVGAHLSTAKALLAASQPARGPALAEVERALGNLQLFAPPDAARQRSPARHAHRRELEDALRKSLADAVVRLRTTDPAGTPQSESAARSAYLDRATAHIPALAAEIRRSIEESQQAAESKRRATMLIVGVLSAAILLLAVLIGVSEYRGVMIPLHQLSQGVRTIAAARFTGRLDPRGHGEFVSLANDFNQIATQLDDLYRDLEQKVAQKSRDLVRSERLASVGYLAAGVAHEINNPLAIIAGHAELSLAQLAKQHDAQTAAEAERTLQVICEESFRCKQITEKLLSLSRPGPETRSPVSLAALAQNVIAIVTALKPYQDRKLTLDVQTPDATILATEGEIKQVVLNLVLNALEATPPNTGEVRITIARANDQIELSVQDNGRGMALETLNHIFEPFFTARRNGDPASPDTPPRGTGLGLSITHAIVQSHGGTITAQSPGEGKGSRFTVHFPIA